MVASKFDLQRIRLYKPNARADYKPMIEEVAQLYQAGKIPKQGSKSGIYRALQIAERLGAPRQRTRDIGLRQFEELKSGISLGSGVKLKTFFVKGRVKTTEQWVHKRTGEKSKQYSENYKLEAMKIRATTKEEAKKQFAKQMHSDFDYDRYEKESKVTDVFIDDVKDAPPPKLDPKDLELTPEERAKNNAWHKENNMDPQNPRQDESCNHS